jgi:hypothetical protein
VSISGPKAGTTGINLKPRRPRFTPNKILRDQVPLLKAGLIGRSSSKRKKPETIIRTASSPETKFGN